MDENEQSPNEAVEQITKNPIPSSVAKVKDPKKVAAEYNKKARKNKNKSVTTLPRRMCLWNKVVKVPVEVGFLKLL